jgi:hypothetical protein
MKLIRHAAKIAAGFILAAIFIGYSQASATPQTDVFVLPDGFRVQMVYLPTMERLIEVINASKPKKLVLHVCTLTPPRVLSQVLKDLDGRYPESPEVVRSGRQALECSFPDDRDRKGRGT